MKNRKLAIVLAIQVIIIVFLMAGLFSPKETYELDAASFVGAGEYRDGEWYIDESHGAQDTFLTSEEISIPSGVYKIQLFYETDTNMSNYCSISDPFAAHGEVLSSGEQLFAGLNATDYEVWLMDGNGSLKIEVSYGGAGTLAVQGARIYNTGAMERMLLFAALVLFVVADGLWMYYQSRKTLGISVENKVTVLALAAIILYSSFPLLTDYLLYAGDLGFHLLRIEGVKDGLLAGQFPVKIAPNWQQGYGYACSVFYGDTFLYIPALFRIIGFSIQSSYKMFLFLLNVGTCLISYYAFKKVLKHGGMGVLGSMLYTMSIYRFFKMYHSAGLGEVISLMFFPLLLVGFYKIFTEDIKDKKYHWNWVLPTIGFCGIIQSHTLNTYIVGMFTILLCVILWKKVFRKETFLVLAETVIFTVLICAWFLIPFFDYMADGNFIINNVSGREIQERGLQIAQLFKIFYMSGDNYHFYATGMLDAEPLGLGGALLGGSLMFVVLKVMGLTENSDKKLLNGAKVALVLAACAMVMSTSIFPWDRIQRLTGLTATLVSSLQFPTRFLSVATLALVFVTCVAGVCIWKMEKPAWKVGFAAAIGAMFLVGNIFVLNDITDTREFFRLYGVGGMGTGYISGAEYLPVGTDASLLMYGDAVAGENVTVTEYEKEYLTVELTCENASAVASFVELPILYYEGYQAKDALGESMTVCAGDNNVVRVMIPEGYSGEVSVEFVRPAVWRVAEIISALFTVSLVGISVWRKRKEKSLCAK